MSESVTQLNKMMLIWNTEDEANKAALASEALEHNLHFVDPNHNIIGRDLFLKMVAGTQAKVPGANYARVSEIDIQNNFCRYHWAITLEGKTLMKGFDVAEINDAGKVVRVIGFFGELKSNDS